MTVLERLSENPRELARAFTRATSDGCPPEVAQCRKDSEGWDACDECYLAWLLSEEAE
ncbi:MAG: hypothetical protein IJP43_08975 [Oscillospiraceae bacterium]|nr:hypothetical protein [Oscillospiraceae bacterium]